MATMKLVTQVDPNNPNVGDIYMGATGTDRLTENLTEEVQQLLLTRFRMFQGEWYLDTTVGVPYFQSILGIKQASSLVSAILRQVITTCPGVASLDNFATTQNGRTFSLAFSATLTDGAVLTVTDFQPLIITGSPLPPTTSTG